MTYTTKRRRRLLLIGEQFVLDIVNLNNDKILTSSKLVLPTPRAPRKAALSGPRYHGGSLAPSNVIRYAEYHLFCIFISMANEIAAPVVTDAVGCVDVPVDVVPPTFDVTAARANVAAADGIMAAVAA